MKRIISCLLVLVMLLAMLPMPTHASNATTVATSAETPVISIESTYGKPGGTMDVYVLLPNNPGITSANLSVSFDEQLMLIGAENGEAFASLSYMPPNQLENSGTISSSCQFAWFAADIADEKIKNGIILKLIFQVTEDAEVGKTYSITVSGNDVVDKNLNEFTLAADTKVAVIDYTPGDVNDDGSITMLDVVLLCRYIVDGCKYDPDGYGVNVNESASNVNDDGKISMLDVVLLCRYIVDGCTYDSNGYAVKLLPETPKCVHSMQATSAKVATCTENGNNAYWYCSDCGKYFSDETAQTELAFENTVIEATGHNVVVDEAVAPTYTSTGLTEGSHCSVCSEVLVAQEVLPALQRKEHAITYNLTNGDGYLAQQSIQNSNPNTFTEDELVVLKNLSVPGYQFLGWYDGAGDNATQIKRIEQGTTYDVELVAHWKKIEYKVQFKSSIYLEESELTYTVDTGVVLPTPKLSNYIFTGWTGEDGKLYDNTMIPSGTTGNIVLTANWTSERNKTWTKTKLDAPIVEIDEENNTLLFVYEIGAIENVPLYTIKDFGYISGDGVTKTETATYSVTISETAMQTYAKAVSSATTQSSNWTLSADWNEITSIDEEWYTENGYTKEEAETLAKSDTETWNISSGSSGSKETTKLETNQDNWQRDVQLNGGVSTEQSAEKSASLEVNAGWDNGDSAGLNLGIGGSGSVTTEDSISYSMGYENGGEWGESKLDTDSTTDTSGWNRSTSHNTSSTISSSSTTSTAISEKISETYGYGKSYTSGGSSSNFQGLTASQSASDEYSSSVTYSTETSTEVTSTWTTQSTKPGYHRWVVAGTAHVFAVVGYDMATKSYFVYTYSVIDDETYEYEDYSYTTANYNDEQNGVISFEVPYEVAEYVAAFTSHSEGLKVSQNTGTITGYSGTDNCVIIPEYMNIGNEEVIKITGISSDAFQGNTNISAVVLSDYITEIPDNAYAGCTSLLAVMGRSIKTIGSNAFSGCTSVELCEVDDTITSIGENAFNGVGRIVVDEANADVLEDASKSGAKKIELYVTTLDGCPDTLTGKTLDVPSTTESFEFNGNKKTYTDFTIDSNASKTSIKDTFFVSDNHIPLRISSSEVVFNNASVHAAGIAMVLSADNANVGLQGTITVKSDNTNALLSKNLSLYELNPSVDGKLEVIDKILVCGEVTGKDFLSYNAYETIDLDTFNKLPNSYTLSFDLDGGTCGETSRTVANCVPIGELPIPQKAHHTFVGWYLSDGVTQATAETVFSTDLDQTLYAHWEPNPVSGWVKASELPEGAQVVNRKWSYTLREYTSSSSSTLSGYTKYDTQRTGWGATIGPVYSDPSNGSRNVWSEVYEVSRTHYYHYYRYKNPSNGYGSDTSWGSYTVYESVDLTYMLTEKGTMGSTQGYKWYYNGDGASYRTMWLEYEWDDVQTGTRWYYQEPVYTYYFYRDVSKEATSNPTGQSNVSNVVEWVQYRAK